MKLTLLLSLSLLFSFSVIAQKTDKEITEQMQFLKGEHRINIQFDYDSLMVGEMLETDYINREVEEKENREPGRGEIWRTKWENDKKRFSQHFEILLNKYLEKEAILVSSDSTAKYTIIVKTKKIEPGYNIGGSGNPALVDFVIRFVETKNPNQNLVKVRLNKVEGALGVGPINVALDVGTRVSESYGVAGKYLAKYILKYTYKK